MQLHIVDDSPDLRFAGSPSLRLRRKEGTKILVPHPLSSEAEERVGKQSDAGVSRLCDKLAL